MMQGFYMLAMRRARWMKRIALLACLLALACSFFAVRAYFTPQAVLASVPEEPVYTARSENGRLIILRDGQTVLRTGIDTRPLPLADREALAQGITLSDETAVARLLEDYGS